MLSQPPLGTFVRLVVEVSLDSDQVRADRGLPRCLRPDGRAVVGGRLPDDAAADGVDHRRTGDRRRIGRYGPGAVMRLGQFWPQYGDEALLTFVAITMRTGTPVPVSGAHGRTDDALDDLDDQPADDGVDDRHGAEVSQMTVIYARANATDGQDAR